MCFSKSWMLLFMLSCFLLAYETGTETTVENVYLKRRIEFLIGSSLDYQQRSNTTSSAETIRRSLFRTSTAKLSSLEHPENRKVYVYAAFSDVRAKLILTRKSFLEVIKMRENTNSEIKFELFLEIQENESPERSKKKLLLDLSTEKERSHQYRDRSQKPFCFIIQLQNDGKQVQEVVFDQAPHPRTFYYCFSRPVVSINGFYNVPHRFLFSFKYSSSYY
ncbi:hypothetical protein ACHWQZ_G017740 [Mnemiopsis leidyi]